MCATGQSVCLSVCSLVTTMNCGKMSDSTELPFKVMYRVGQRNHLLGGCVHRCHLANTVERLCTAAMNGSATRVDDPASSQITVVELNDEFLQ